MEELTPGQRREQKVKARARLGQRGLQRKVNNLVAKGPQTILRALNVFHATFESRPFTWDNLRALPVECLRSLHSAFFPLRLPDVQGDPKLLISLWMAVGTIKEATDCMVKTDDPRCKNARSIIKGDLHQLMVGAKRCLQDAQEALTRLPKLNLSNESIRYMRGLFESFRNQPTFDNFDDIMTVFSGEGEAYREFVRLSLRYLYLDISSDLVLFFWNCPDDWLGRLRKCAYQECTAPYFLDRTAAGHTRFCPASKGKHKTYYHRKSSK